MHASTLQPRGIQRAIQRATPSHASSLQPRAPSLQPYAPSLQTCPRLQVVEVATLNEHLLTECDRSQPFSYPPPLGTHAEYTGCPLCGELQHTDDPELWKEHLLHHCQANERRTGAGAAA